MSDFMNGRPYPDRHNDQATSGITNGPTNEAGSRHNGHASHNQLSLANLDPRNSETTFAQVREQVAADDSGKWDLLISRHDLRLRDGQIAVPEDYSYGYPSMLAPTPWALGQLCQRLNIPTAYFRRCPTPLQDQQFNYWTQQKPGQVTPNSPLTAEDSVSGLLLPDTGDASVINHVSQDSNGKASENATLRGPEFWLLRNRYGTLRGVLSDRYAKLDNFTLLNCLEPLLNERHRIALFALADESLHLRLVDKTLTREILPDDQVSVGIHVANSEVGMRAVTVDALVYRLVCSNGMIRLVKGKSLLHRRHIHLSETTFAAVLQQSTSQALMMAAGFIEQLKWSTHEPVKDVEHTLKRLGERWNLAQGTQDVVKQALLQERSDQQESVYGLANALTAAAQLLPADDRYQLEVLAGRLVENGLRHSDRWLSDRQASDRSSSERLSQQQHRISHSRSRSHTNGSTPVAETPVAAKPIPVQPRSIGQLAQEMFDAEIVGRSSVSGLAPERSGQDVEDDGHSNSVPLSVEGSSDSTLASSEPDHVSPDYRDQDYKDRARWP